MPAQSTIGVYLASPNPASIFPLNDGSITKVGGSLSHSNLMPFLCVNFVIALFGIYPSRQ